VIFKDKVTITVLNIGQKNAARERWWECLQCCTLKAGGKKLLGRPCRGWEDSVKMNLKERGCMGFIWIHLADDRANCGPFLNTVMNVWVL
jgi:hypothetical protein